MLASENGINLIKFFEGKRNYPYKVAGANEKYYTVGYGHYGKDVILRNYTDAEIETFLLDDIFEAEQKVNKYMEKYHFNQNQYDALCSFVFNIGSLEQLTANGTRTISEISTKIPLYCNAGGKRMDGLVKRRNAEKSLFDTPVSGVKEETLTDKKTRAILLIEEALKLLNAM